ncbi:hypothetical protein BKA69DRAFT_1034824 [Paraphysoderma sedebokerense]|nr:hypothetical protein BKA69DRAFT_1034824 [Paraphysoderma sedebokerense]
MTIGISIEAGTLLSISLSLLLVVKHTTLPRITILGRLRGTQDKFKSIKEFPLETTIFCCHVGINIKYLYHHTNSEHLPGTLLIKIEEPLHFANTGELRERLQRIERFGDMSVHPSEETRLGRVEHVVFDIESMPWIDARSLSSVTSLHIVDSIKQSPRHVHVLTFQGFQLNLYVLLVLLLHSIFPATAIAKPFPPGLSVADVQTTLKTIFPGGIPKKLPVTGIIMLPVIPSRPRPNPFTLGGGVDIGPALQSLNTGKTISSHQNDGISFGNNFGNEVPKLQGSGLKVVPINNAKLHEFRVDASGGGTNRILLDLKNNKLFFTSDLMLSDRFDIE